MVLAAVVPASIAAVVSIYVATRQSRMQTKVDETHHELTVNGHVSDSPTMRDQLDTLGQQLADHITSSEKDRQNLWRAVWWAYRRAQERKDETEYDDN